MVRGGSSPLGRTSESPAQRGFLMPSNGSPFHPPGSGRAGFPPRTRRAPLTTELASGDRGEAFLFVMPLPVVKRAPGRWESAGVVRPRDRNTESRDWHKQSLEDAALRDMPLHALRHTAAAAWLAAGNSLMYVQRQLGHADISTTRALLRPSRAPCSHRRCGRHRGGRSPGQPRPGLVRWLLSKSSRRSRGSAEGRRARYLRCRRVAPGGAIAAVLSSTG